MNGIFLALLFLGLAAGGCASLGSYEQAKQEAEQARQAYEQEARRSEELTAQTKKLKEELDLLELKLRKAREDIERRDREYQEVREALGRLKGRPAAQGQAAPGSAGASAAPPTPEETKARIKELMRELQAIVEQ